MLRLAKAQALRKGSHSPSRTCGAKTCPRAPVREMTGRLLPMTCAIDRRGLQIPELALVWARLLTTSGLTPELVTATAALMTCDLESGIEITALTSSDPT